MTPVILAGLLPDPAGGGYSEPYDTIGAAALGLLMLVHLVGVPATLAVTAVCWGQRTRGRSALAAGTGAAAGPPPAAPAAPADSPPADGPPAANDRPTMDGAPATPAVPAAVATRGEAFLHLQQLEREVLALATTPAAPAAPGAFARLAAETAGLSAAHGPDSIVGRHADGLLAVVQALAPLDTPNLPTDPPQPPAEPPRHLPDRLRAGLARLAAAGRPIPATWAFAWQAHRPDRWPVTADRYRDLLEQEFTRRYGELYPYGGMILVLTDERLTLRYQPASARFGGQSVEIPTDLPEVTRSPEVAQRLDTVVGAALRELPPAVS